MKPSVLALVGLMAMFAGIVLMLFGMAGLTDYYHAANLSPPEVVPYADYAIPLLVASFVLMLMGAAFFMPVLWKPKRPPRNDSSPLLSFKNP